MVYKTHGLKLQKNSRCSPTWMELASFHFSPRHNKQVQDSPRLKSIIKGALGDRPEPKSLDKIKIEDVPRTNPVNLVSVLA
jgi:hypothetical protein